MGENSSVRQKHIQQIHLKAERKQKKKKEEDLAEAK